MITALRDKIIKKSFQIRLVEQQLLTLFQEGKINGTVHTCIGQELIGVCAAEFLNDTDIVLSNHRGHGHFLARNEDLVTFFAEIMGRQNGVCGGKGGSQHLFSKNHLSNGIQGGMTPIGVGIALANKIQNNNNVVMCFIGDGTLGEGIIYEAFNLASLWDLPIIFVLENNKVAQSTNIEQTFSGSIKERATGFGLEYFSTNTWNLEHLLQTFEKATTRSRKQHKATFIEVETYRLNSHSKGDDNRNQSDIDANVLTDLLNKEIVNHKEATSKLLSAIQKEINEAVAVAEKSPLTTHNFTQAFKKDVLYTKQEITTNTTRINQLIHEALFTQFKTDSNSILIGEDIEYLTKWTNTPYGGAFKVSNDLSEHFKNVKNTPISEAAITGVGTGLAIGGMQPIVEIMFGDFLTLTFDQIYNHACKFYGMYNAQISIPLVIRTPMGGKRGYGPTHSQSIEKHFLGIPNLTMVALNYRVNPKQLYKGIFKENNPVLVIENKVLYTKKIKTEVLPGYEFNLSDEKYPTVKINPQNRKADITIVCYGEMLEDVEEATALAFYEEEIFCEIICPAQINPINITPIILSVSHTKSLLTIEEGSNVAAYSAEIVTQIIEENIQLKSFKRLANNDIIPSSTKAELDVLPNINSIFKKIKETFNAK